MEYIYLLALLVAFVGCFVPRDATQCNFISALIGAGASLIGGALNRNAQKKANAANSPVGQVRQWEQAGINPIFGVSSGGYIPQQATSIGDAFATAGGKFAQALDMRHEKELRETGLKLENQLLKKQLDKMSEKPVASYLSQAIGGTNVAPVSSRRPRHPSDSGNALGDIARVIAPGRDVKVTPVESTPLMMEVNSALTGNRSYPVLGSDGEPMDIWQMLAVGGQLAPQMLWDDTKRAGRNVLDGYIKYIGDPFVKNQWNPIFDKETRENNKIEEIDSLSDWIMP